MHPTILNSDDQKGFLMCVQLQYAQYERPYSWSAKATGSVRERQGASPKNGFCPPPPSTHSQKPTSTRVTVQYAPSIHQTSLFSVEVRGERNSFSSNVLQRFDEPALSSPIQTKRATSHSSGARTAKIKTGLNSSTIEWIHACQDFKILNRPCNQGKDLTQFLNNARQLRLLQQLLNKIVLFSVVSLSVISE
jgi:hypothetical protein